MKELISPKLLKIIAIWSLIPSYMVAGGAVGYGLDKWFSTFPYLTGACLLVAFSLAIHDMMRLKKELER